jgi:hypothetical protein
MQAWEGVLPEESNEAYHRRPEFSSSDVKWMLESPLHFHSNVIKKSEVVREHNAAFDLGTCAHECLLLRDTSGFVALPAGLDRRTKEGKVIYADFCEEHKGKRIITLDQQIRLDGMMKVILANKKVMEFFEGSEFEKGALYQDQLTGLNCKFRPDIINPSRGFIVDYKTAESANPYKFSKAVVRFGYHISASHYLTGANRLWNGTINDYYFIVQESSFPYAVGLYRMDATDILRSHELRNSLMVKIKHHVETNTWCDWSDEVRRLNIPGYGFSEEAS